MRTHGVWIWEKILKTRRFYGYSNKIFALKGPEKCDWYKNIGGHHGTGKATPSPSPRLVGLRDYVRRHCYTASVPNTAHVWHANGVPSIYCDCLIVGPLRPPQNNIDRQRLKIDFRGGIFHTTHTVYTSAPPNALIFYGRPAVKRRNRK